MKTIPQYVTKGGRRFYYSVDDVLCSNCKDVIKDFLILILEWDKKKSESFEFCFRCAKKHKQIGKVQEKFVMCITDKKPLGSILVLISPPELINSNKDDSLFSNSLDCSHVNNKAIRSGHPDYTILDDNAPALIGVPVDNLSSDKYLELKIEENIKKLLGMR